MLTYILEFILLTICLLIYFRLARRFNIIDKPNERSSHSVQTIRGGGVIFPLAALAWFLTTGFTNYLMIIGLMLIATVSFIDDIHPVSSIIRITIHLLAVSLLFLQSTFLELPWYFIMAGYFLAIGWINIFNFMDGINGITAFYSVASLLSFYLVNRSVPFIDNNFIIFLLISLAVFSFFNARKKALAFSGDVGSVSMAFLLTSFMAGLILKTGRIEYLLLFSVYGIDSAITIFFRLRKRENIFRPHRTHLYQLLSNELRWPHILVSLIYALIQLFINIATIALFYYKRMNPVIFIGMLAILTMIYLLIRFRVRKAVQVSEIQQII